MSGLNKSDSSKGQIININFPPAAKVYFISLKCGRNSGTTITYSRSSFCNIFYDWESSRGPYVVQAWPTWTQHG